MRAHEALLQRAIFYNNKKKMHANYHKQQFIIRIIKINKVSFHVWFLYFQCWTVPARLTLFSAVDYVSSQFSSSPGDICDKLENEKKKKKRFLGLDFAKWSKLIYSLLINMVGDAYFFTNNNWAVAVFRKQRPFQYFINLASISCFTLVHAFFLLCKHFATIWPFD